jgi:hypothetical protein
MQNNGGAGCEWAREARQACLAFDHKTGPPQAMAFTRLDISVFAPS